MGNSLIFKAGMNDSDFTAGLKRMETRTAESAKKINAGLSQGSMKGHGAGGARIYGDALDAITGQYGGVMKMNAAVHMLGFGLATAFGAVGVAMLGEKVYEDTEKVRELNKELDKIQRGRLSASASSMSDIGKRMDEAQNVKEGFETMSGTNPTQSRLSVLGRTVMNMFADMLTPGTNTTLAGRHGEAQKAGAERAQAMQQSDADALARKMNDQSGAQYELIIGNEMNAALLKEELETREKIGALMKRAVEDNVDLKAATEAELHQQVLRRQVIMGQTFQQKFAASHAYEAMHVAENDKSNVIDRQTAEKRRNELERHLTLRQQRNLLQNDVNDQLGQAKGAEHSLLRRSEIRARIGDDINQARELAAQRSMMSPHERNQQSRNERRMQRAADAAERRITRGMSPDERKAFREQQTALKGAVKNNATIDDGSITKLTAAIRDAVGLLIAQ